MGGASVLVKCESNGVFPSCSGAKKKKRKDFCSYQCTFCKGKIHGELCNLVKLARLLFLNRVAVSARGHEDNEAPLSDISEAPLSDIRYQFDRRLIFEVLKKRTGRSGLLCPASFR